MTHVDQMTYVKILSGENWLRRRLELYSAASQTLSCTTFYKLYQSTKLFLLYKII